MKFLITRPEPSGCGRSGRFDRGMDLFLTFPGSPCLDLLVEGSTETGLHFSMGVIGNMLLNYNDRLTARSLENACCDGGSRRISIEGIQ